LESFVAFFLVIGLSIEDPSFNRTTINESFSCSESLGLTLPETGNYV
jgi:hypothetical protein